MSLKSLVISSEAIWERVLRPGVVIRKHNNIDTHRGRLWMHRQKRTCYQPRKTPETKFLRPWVWSSTPQKWRKLITVFTWSMVLCYKKLWKPMYHICLKKKKWSRDRPVGRISLSLTSSMTGLQHDWTLSMSQIPMEGSLGGACRGRLQGPLQSAGEGWRQMLLGLFMWHSWGFANSSDVFLIGQC